MSEKKTIRNFARQIKGYVEEKPNGDKVVTDFGGRILGYYHASSDTTTHHLVRRDRFGTYKARLKLCIKTFAAGFTRRRQKNKKL